MSDPGRWSPARPVELAAAVRRGLAGEAARCGPLVALGVLGSVLLARYERRESVRVLLDAEPVRCLEVSIADGQTYRDVLAAAKPAGGEDADVLVDAGAGMVAAEHPTARLRIHAARCGALSVAARGFSANQVDVLRSCFSRFCTAVVAAPTTPVNRLPLVDGDLVRAVRRDPPPSPDPSLEPCVRSFEEHARARPGRIAVSACGRSISYGELDARAAALAAELARRGVGRGSLVGLTGRPSPGLVTGIVAVHKLGAGYVPLDPANPGARLRGIARDSGLRVAVDCGGGWRPAGGAPDIVELAASTAHPDQGPAPDRPDAVTAGDVAYVLYTSGSTGAPKGVRVTQGNIARLFTETDHLFGFGADDVWTFYHSFAFDFSVWEIWGALVHGARLVVVPYEVSRDPARFLDLLAAERVTVLSQTPSAFTLLRAEDARRERPPDLALRHVVFGGEALDYRTLAPWVERHPLGRPRLVNMYGITETTVHVTAHEIGTEDLGSGARTVGRPIRDLRVYLVDEFGNPVPDGATGEMWVAGPGVALGYLNRPDLTRDRFVRLADPGGTVLYRSGDLARLDPAGRLVFAGRADEQVKVRGYRIELGEVEAAVRAHPRVETACVTAEPDDRGPTRLVAYLVLAGTDTLHKRDLFAFVSARLPTYMIPQRWIAVPRLPLTVNGKVDRAELARSAAAVPPL